jgi:DNA-binding response OmpR family regulator
VPVRVVLVRGQLPNPPLGYEVVTAADGVSGEQAAVDGGFSCIVLDIILPKRNGYELCRNLRRSGILTPVLILTARNTNVDVVLGLKLGGDDFLTKPFDTEVLLARIEALIRRSRATVSPSESSQAIQFGDCVLDLQAQTLKRKGIPVELNAIEYRLLKHLVLNPGAIISRQRLLDEVWGYDSETATRTVDVHIARVRQKIGEGPGSSHLKTVRGLGYRFDLHV